MEFILRPFLGDVAWVYGDGRYSKLFSANVENHCKCWKIYLPLQRWRSYQSLEEQKARRKEHVPSCSCDHRGALSLSRPLSTAPTRPRMAEFADCSETGRPWIGCKSSPTHGKWWGLSVGKAWRSVTDRASFLRHLKPKEERASLPSPQHRAFWLHYWEFRKAKTLLQLF